MSGFLQEAYAKRRRVWTDEVGEQITAFLTPEADRLRAAGGDPADTDAVAEHMRKMEVEMPE